MDEPIKNSTEPPECFRRIEELLNSTEIQRLQSDTSSLNAYHGNLKRDCNAVGASLLSDNQKLRDELDALKKTIAAKDAEVHSLRTSGNNMTELAHIGEQLQALKDDTNALVTENRLLREIVNEIKAHAKASNHDQAIVSELQAKLTSEQKASEQLTTKLTESSSALKQITDLSRRLRSRNQNTERELEKLRTKLDAAEKDRDRLRKQRAEMLEAQNKINEARASDNQRFVQQRSRLKQEKSVLAQKLHQTVQDIASFVTDLDLAAEEVRVYTCSHKDFKEINLKSGKSTRIKPMRMISSEMYNHWAGDAGFQEGYANARKTIHRHHLAHWDAGHRNGDDCTSLMWVWNELNQKRGMPRWFP